MAHGQADVVVHQEAARAAVGVKRERLERAEAGFDGKVFRALEERRGHGAEAFALALVGEIAREAQAVAEHHRAAVDAGHLADEPHDGLGVELVLRHEEDLQLGVFSLHRNRNGLSGRSGFGPFSFDHGGLRHGGGRGFSLRLWFVGRCGGLLGRRFLTGSFPFDDGFVGLVIQVELDVPGGFGGQFLSDDRRGDLGRRHFAGRRFICR